MSGAVRAVEILCLSRYHYKLFCYLPVDEWYTHLIYNYVILLSLTTPCYALPYVRAHDNK